MEVEREWAPPDRQTRGATGNAVAPRRNEAAGWKALVGSRPGVASRSSTARMLSASATATFKRNGERGAGGAGAVPERNQVSLPLLVGQILS